MCMGERSFQRTAFHNLPAHLKLPAPGMIADLEYTYGKCDAGHPVYSCLAEVVVCVVRGQWCLPMEITRQTTALPDVGIVFRIIRILGLDTSNESA